MLVLVLEINLHPYDTILVNTITDKGKRKQTVIAITTQITPIVLYPIIKCVQNGNTPNIIFKTRKHQHFTEIPLQNQSHIQYLPRRIEMACACQGLPCSFGVGQRKGTI